MPFNHVAPACRHGQPDWRFCRSESWRALEAVYREGRTRAIGVSNYEARTVSDLPCNVRREGGQSLVIGVTSLVMSEGREGNPL